MADPLRHKNAWQQWLARLSPSAKRKQIALSQRGTCRIVPAWHVVYINDEEAEPRFQQFACLESMRQFLLKLPPRTFVIPFYGVMARYTLPPPGSDRRYLVHPDGRLIPLYNAQDEVVLDSSFFLGPRDEELRPARRPPPARQRQPEQQPISEDEVDYSSLEEVDANSEERF